MRIDNCQVEIDNYSYFQVKEKKIDQKIYLTEGIFSLCSSYLVSFIKKVSELKRNVHFT